MSRVIYTKYNSLRKPEYRITTEIHEEEGTRWVKKKTGNEAALPHLERIMSNQGIIAQLYNNIQSLEVRREGDSLIFPFVSGTPLDKKIRTDRLVKEELIDQINQLFDQILSVKEENRCIFKASDEFRAVFGDQYPEGIPAISPANIDSLFNNFVETEQGIFCLDYEWVYHFPIPVEYIKFRALLYFHNEWAHSLFDGITREELMSWFGLDEVKQAIYWNIESHFQQAIHGKEWLYFYLQRYQKRRLNVQDLYKETEQQKITIHDKDVHISNIEQAMKDKDNRISDMEKAIHDKDVHIANIIANDEKVIHDKDVHISNLEQQLIDFTNSFFWRITKPAQGLVNGTRKMVQKNSSIYLFLRCTKAAVRRGPAQARAVREQYKAEIEKAAIPKGWPTAEEAEEQKKTPFSKDIRFSILVPLYNTPKEYLLAMIRSVQDQTYDKWELCLADGSDAKHRYVRRTCKKLARKDPRIRYRKLEKNLGISGNTNACIEMATGDFIALFDHDDILHPSALYEDMRVICEKDADFIYTDENTFHDYPADAYQPHYKPNFAPDTLRANNYICHFTVFRKDLLKETGGGFRPECDGSQDFDMVLRLTEKAKRIEHIPKVLYYWRAHKNSVAESVTAKPYVIEAAKKAINEHLERVGLEGEALDSPVPSMYRLKYRIQGEPLISILIPNMDHVEDLERCIDSILTKSTYPHYEIIIIENNSREEATFAFYDRIVKTDPRIRIVRWGGIFNYSAINNFGAREAKGEYILLLNNDTEVISPDWLQEMLMYSQRSDVGAVGAKLYYPDHTIQHAGLGLGILTLAGHYHRHFDGNHPGYMGRLIYAQDLTAVTAACMMIPRRVFDEVSGLDETFEVAFNDVDLCMRIRKAGYLIVWTPYAELYHYESKSRGLDDAPEKRERFLGEVTRFQERWKKELEDGDPYYNPNFTLDKEDFSFKDP